MCDQENNGAFIKFSKASAGGGRPTPRGSAPSNSATFGASEVYKPHSEQLMLEPQYGGRNSGSDNMAKIHRSEWENYRSRFAPVEDMLFDRFQDTGRTEEAVKSAGQTMASAFDRSKDQTAREMSRYGVSQTGDVAEASDRTFGLKQAAATAGARNGMRTAMEDQKMGIMSGGLSTVATQRSK